MPAEYTIHHNAAVQRFEYSENGATAFVEYSFHHGSIDLLHTIVPESLGGKGVAAALAAFAFKFAKEQDLPVIVHCPYIDSYVKKHPELLPQLYKQPDLNA